MNKKEIKKENKEAKDDFVEQFGKVGRIIAEEKQKELDKKRQQFLDLIEGKDAWKIRVSLSATDVLVISRVLCRSLSLDDVLQKQLYAIFSCREEKSLVNDVLHKLLLSFRMSSSHREDRVTHPDYREKKWHGRGLDIIHGIKEAFDASYKFVDAQRLTQDSVRESVGSDEYRKNIKESLTKIIEKEVR